jgi:hypothetical protein
LLLRARQGKLTVYRLGKVYLTTLADVREKIRACRVSQRGHGCGSTQLDTTPTARVGFSPTGSSKLRRTKIVKTSRGSQFSLIAPISSSGMISGPLSSLSSHSVFKGERHRSSSLLP